jgi:pre-rRNA-processing protein TSR1
MAGHSHRSGALKQTNKRNKRSKSSKRSINKLAGGKVEGRRVAFKQHLVAHTKADRRHIQQQHRELKRQELLRRKRGLDGGSVPPRVVGIISLGESEDPEEQLRVLILGQADQVVKTQEENSETIISAKFEVHKKDGNLTVLTNSTAFKSQYANEGNTDAAVLAALDLCRVCDIILFVIDGDAGRSEDFVGMSIGGDDPSMMTGKTSNTAQEWDHLISERGDRILAAVKGQGIPRVATVLARSGADLEVPDDDMMTTQSAKSVRRANHNRKADLKKYISRFATTEFGVNNDKVVEVSFREDEGNDEMELTEKVTVEYHTKQVLAAALIRTLCSMPAAPSKWVSQLPRAFLVAEKQSHDASTQELHLTGFVRGAVPFDVNALVHVPNLGTFACKCIRKACEPMARRKAEAGMPDDLEVVESDPLKRESLSRFATPDALDGEQNLIGFDEADEELVDDEVDDHADDFARPAGWSDYQSAWLDAVEDDGTQADFDHGELAKELNKKSTATVATEMNMDLDDANRISAEERKSLLEQRRKEQQEHNDFPDEVQVNEDEKARDRFARYRSLKSFKKSSWDPKENLPESYSSIYHFASFKTTQRAVMADMRALAKAARDCEGRFWGKQLNGNSTEDDVEMEDCDEDDDILEGCVPSGTYVTLTLEQVPRNDYDVLGASALLTAVSLLSHENKVSVLHMGLTQGSNCNASKDIPVKSKDVLTFRCGWRSWTGRPVFSQNNLNCDKHKFERFLPANGSFFAASVFGPVTYSPCPVLVFRSHNGKKELVATGSMIGADADRIVVKRIVLTGYPVRVHKRFATVKYMFYDPEDVKWFKPADIVTKHGLNGKIQESVGEHGTMKCLFNAPIKQHDTVCLPLYKRVYPKFVDPSAKPGDDIGTVRSIWRGHALTVK